VGRHEQEGLHEAGGERVGGPLYDPELHAEDIKIQRGELYLATDARAPLHRVRVRSSRELKFTNAVETYFSERFCCRTRTLLPIFVFEKNRNTACVSSLVLS